MKTFLIGYFEVDGFGPDLVETEATGTPHAQYTELNRLVKARYPSVDMRDIKRTGSKFESRPGPEEEGYEGPIKFFAGATLRQLFTDETGADTITSRKIGQVFFTGTPTVIHLLYSRAGGFIGVNLAPQIGGCGPINFNTKINPGRQVAELEGILTELFGAEAKALKLNFEEVI